MVVGICTIPLAASEITEKSTGNFAHKITPATTFGIGQNIFEKNAIVAYVEFDQLSYKDDSFMQLVPSFIYAFSDSLSFYTGLPILLKQKKGEDTQRGIGNLFAELEYAFFNKTTPQAFTRGTILGNITFPTTHFSHSCDYQTTTTAHGSFFVGATLSHTSTRWYGYLSGGARFFLEKNDVKSGSSFLYEGGIGMNLSNPWGITALGVIEANGILTKKDTRDCQENNNTGSNLIFVGPSVCFTGNRWLISGGIQVPLYQNLNGIQSETRFRSALIMNIVF